MVVESVAVLSVEQSPILSSVPPAVIEEHPCTRELNSQFDAPANYQNIHSHVYNLKLRNILNVDCVLSSSKEKRNYLRRRKDNLALLLISTSDDHQTTNSWAITENTAIFVGTECVSGTMLQKMKTLLIDGQPQNAWPV